MPTAPGMEGEEQPRPGGVVSHPGELGTCTADLCQLATAAGGFAKCRIAKELVLVPSGHSEGRECEELHAGASAA